MPSVSLYFQVHQPFRLRRYTFFEIGHSHDYFDDDGNARIFRRVASKCYLPTNRKILELIRRHDGAFQVAYSLTGVAVEQMRLYAPEVIESFEELASTGAVEFLGETYHHTLCAIHDEVEFRDQIRLHSDLMEELFGVRPTVFRNTELVYNDRIGRIVADAGFKASLAEGADDILDWRSPNFLYKAPGLDLKLLLKNYRLSDDIAFRFSNRAWKEWPLTAEKFADWVHRANGNGEVVNLFMDYETFGEHQWQETRIFDFLDHLPKEIMRDPGWDFRTPSQVVESLEPVGELSYGRTVSWADVERDLSAWEGNNMQRQAAEALYSIAEEVRRRNNPAALSLWRKLLSSDHFYYICTKWFADGDVHKYFNPYESPYDAFINLMNVVTDFREGVLGQAAGGEGSA